LGASLGDAAMEMVFLTFVVSGTNPTSGRRGLGELVRAGVVMPVSQVNSAVEAMLKLLVTERLLGARLL
jgi:hypothetical protein